MWLAVLQLGSIVVGYDGSLMNGFWAIDDFVRFVRQSCGGGGGRELKQPLCLVRD